MVNRAAWRAGGGIFTPEEPSPNIGAEASAPKQMQGRSLADASSHGERRYWSTSAAADPNAGK